MTYSEPPVWWRYRNEPVSLNCLLACHLEQIERDPGNADWYRGQIAEINTRLCEIVQRQDTAL